ncbi:MAG: TolC family protein [Gammaproteobacteria bacterium]
MLILVAAASAPVPSQATDLLTSYRMALEYDPDFRIALADLEEGNASKAIARSVLLPQVNVSWNIRQIDRTSNNNSEAYDSDQVALSAQMPLVNVSAWHQARSGSFVAASSQATYRDKVQNLMLKVAQLFVEVLRSKDALDAAKALRANMKQQVSQVQLRYSAGLTTINELEEARYGVDNAEAIFLGAQSNFDIAKLSLSTVTGKIEHQLYRLDPNFSEWPVELESTEMIALALTNNFSIQALRMSKQSALSNLKGARAQALPNLNLDVSHTETSTNQFDNIPAAFSAFASNESSDTTVTLSVRLPLFTGGSLHGAKKQASAQYNRLNHQVERAELNLRQEVLALHLRIRNSVATIRANKQALKSATSAEQATRVRYETGTRNILDLSNASQITHNAKRQYQDSRYDHLLLRLQLEQLTGDLELSDLQQINQWLLSTP